MQKTFLVSKPSETNLLPLLKDAEWLNCNPRCFDSNNNLPEFRYPIAWPQLMDGWTTGAVLSFDIPLQLSLAAEGFASQWMLFSRLAEMGWHQVKQEILWKSNEWRLLWLHFVARMNKNFWPKRRFKSCFVSWYFWIIFISLTLSVNSNCLLCFSFYSSKGFKFFFNLTERKFK